MNAFLTWLQDSQTQAAGRNIVSALLGVAGTLGMLTATQSHDLIQAWGDVQSGVAQAAKGISVIGGIIGPLALAWWASHRASPASAKAAVTAMPNTMVVNLPPSASPAEDHDAKVVAASQIAAIPGVANVISTPAVAAETLSTKIVDPAHDPAVTG